MPFSSATSRTPASARMKSASQVVTRSAFRLRAALDARRERRHDGTALDIAHLRPACDLGERAPATEARARRVVEQTDIDARRFQEGYSGCRSQVYVGAAAGPDNRAETPRGRGMTFASGRGFRPGEGK